MATGALYTSGESISKGPSVTPVMQSPAKEVNPVTECKHGQDMTHELVQRCQDIFMLLKQTQLPNGVSVTPASYSDKKNKLSLCVKTIQFYFQQLQACYQRVMEASKGLEHVQVENFIPPKKNANGDGISVSEKAKYSSEERRQLVQQLQAKNIQLKDIIDQIRTVIWDINTMMAMRRM